MKVKAVLKSFICLLLVAIMLQSAQYVFAHSSSQESVLAKSYYSTFGYSK